MKARSLFNRRVTLDADAFAELVIWQVPQALAGSTHHYKYRLVLVVEGHCVLRYDNEAGKGDHRHRGKRETPYAFSSVDALIGDFFKDVTRWRHERGND